ncbi:MAG: hypothetical protein C4576_13850 [Desulfobacteraceae bacterium]|nr:MAG: hypothetical protein C4576_13850 [Desulfobacteraceae bacterium]
MKVEDRSEENADDHQARKWMLVPPGFLSLVELFKSHCHVAEKRPMIIVGDTGVGKSIFLEIYKLLYLKRYTKKDRKNPPIEIINCANYTAELARSELFGHVKGAFTGATRDKSGLIVKVKGGLLILEEIGELEEYVQSNLLTVIEDKWYYRVGDTERKNIEDITFLAATNNLEKLRDDFRQRFLTFEIPPLYMRRDDVFYYIAHMYPEVIRELSAADTLELLTSNWPGNVREVERFCLSIMNRNHYYDRLGGRPVLWEHLLSADQLDSPTSSVRVRLLKILSEGGVDVEALEYLLNCFGLGLISIGHQSFPDFAIEKVEQYTIPDLIDDKLMPGLDFKTLTNYEPFENAYFGFKLFCSLFFQEADGNYNCMQVLKPKTLRFHLDLADIKYRLTKKQQDVFKKLVRSIFTFLSGISLPKDVGIPISFYERIQFFLQLSKDNPSNEFLATLTGRRPQSQAVVENEKPDIYEMPFEDAIKHYCEEVLKRASGNRAEAARKMGVNYHTLTAKFEKMGMTKKKKLAQEQG